MVRPDLHLPPRFVAGVAPFLATFSRRTRSTTAALAVGAVLAVGPRTVTNCLRALGLAEHPSFTAFHRVLNRNTWSGLALARTLLRMVVTTFVPSGPVIIGVDHTLERRRGPRIGPAGRFYDASLRADMPNPTSRGLRWLSAMVLVPVPFAGRIWALPVLTALTPSRSWSEQHDRRHRLVTEWARLMLLAIHRWLPGRPIVAVMDGEFAALEFLHALRLSMAVIMRMRKDARLFDPPPCHDDKPGRAPRKGKRQPLLSERLPDPATHWQRIVQPSRTTWRNAGWIEYAHGTALWHHGGKPIADPVGAGPLSRWPARAGSLPVHGHAGRPPRRAGLLHPALGHGNHVRRSSRPPWDGNAAPMVRPRRVPDDPAAAWALQRGHALCAAECRALRTLATQGGLVPETGSDLCRRPRAPTPASLV